MGNNSINFNDFRTIDSPNYTKTILTVEVNLTRDEILQTLQKEFIFINGNYYIVPEHKLIGCLLNRQYFNIILDLEQIKL